jgi:adenylate cyclase
MRYRTRLVLLVTGLLAGTVIMVAGLLAWNTRNALLASAEESGELVANLLARSAGLANEIPDEVEDMLGQQMIAEATITAHFIDAAEKAGFSVAEIDRRLRKIADETAIDEFWVTDEKGHAYLHNLAADFTFSPSALEEPQAYEFWRLLNGKSAAVVQKERERELDHEPFKYAGVAGVDKPRIVEVGFDDKYLNDVKARVGLGRAVQALLASEDIDAIWVFDTKLSQLAGPDLLKSSTASFPTDREMQAIEEVLKDNKTRWVKEPHVLSVIAPIKTESKGVIGTALVRIPTARMWTAVRNQLSLAALIAVAVLSAGVALSYLLAKQQTAPIEQLTAAASAVEARKFDPDALATVSARPDEIGTLARVFTTMGETVLAREEKLDTLVQERTQALAFRTEQLETLSTKLSKYLSPQVYASIFQGKQGVEIASNRKKLTIFFSDLVGFTETTENLESEELTGILNRYLDEMAGIALRHGATLDKYVGDAILAFFGDPETKGVAEDAKACVAMAIEMQHRIGELEAEWHEQGIERRLRARMGINTGFCTVGNFGSQDRMDYTIIGAAVNLASRLESAAQPGTILISHETWSLVKHVVEAKETPPLKVKGIAQPVHAYEVVALREAASNVIRRSADGLRVSIDLGRSDKTQAIAMLKELIGEIDGGRLAAG